MDNDRLLTNEEIDKIAYSTKDESLIKGWDLQYAMDEMVKRFNKAQDTKTSSIKDTEFHEWLKQHGNQLQVDEWGRVK